MIIKKDGFIMNTKKNYQNKKIVIKRLNFFRLKYLLYEYGSINDLFVSDF